MLPSPAQDVTQLLVAWRNGDEKAFELLVPIIYDELHRLARRYMQRERVGHTLQTTALVNEAYMQLVRQRESNWQGRAHFFAASAQAMRHILVDMARGRNRQRRGGNVAHVALDDAVVFTPERASELMALDDALTALAELDPRKSRIVEMRWFAGLTIEETAEVLNLSHATVEREWQRARAWLAVELRKGAAEGP
ncbi:MAG TPA: sigma-70 family RNA polymerase sigma factor [Bryobacteraceae bacterium]|nr:sigma-70 family RNA polymerase sigma factor [Bryobacteraceae bacterium]